jgi:hypothetical protein
MSDDAQVNPPRTCSLKFPTRVAPLSRAGLLRGWWALTTYQLEGDSPLMITREEGIDAHALHRQGWTISAIACHLGRDRKTIRAYLHGEREAGSVDAARG